MGRYSVRVIVAVSVVILFATACFDSGSSSDDPPESSTTLPSAPVTTSSTVPVTTSSTDRAAGEPLAYTVQEGDTLGLIAQNFNTTVELLVEVNAIEDPNALQVGMELIIPAPGTTASTAPETTSSTVAGGTTTTTTP